MTLNVPQAPVILLVDDDKVSLMAIKRAMRKLGLSNEIISAHDGIKALKFLKCLPNANTADPASVLMILDLNMPRMDGLELLEAVRNNPDLPDLHVLVCTNDTEHVDPVLLETPVEGFIDKDNLHGSLAAALDAQQFSGSAGSCPP
ncbi:MAG: response regulator [Roseobacter sp.]